MILALPIATITIFVRCVYRCAELSGGFNSELFTSDEPLFMVLEGGMISIATISLTVLHPGICFQGAWDSAGFKFRSRDQKSKQMFSDEETAGESVIELSEPERRFR